MVPIPAATTPTLPGFPTTFPAPTPATPGRAAVAGSGGATADTSDIWSSILDSVSNRKGVVTKNLIVLGNSKSGKSTLISGLSSPTGEAASGEDNESNANVDVLNLGLSYSYMDLGDDSEEDTLARLGIYQLPSALPPYPALLPLALSKATLLDSLVLILLDWEKPWSFLQDLKAWIGVLEGVLKGSGEDGAGTGWEGAEARERVEAQLRHYVEPSATPSTTTASSSQLADTESPLPSGVLTDNLGFKLVIVCTKADQINSLERNKDFKEEQFDYIQQVLRTIALRYGAALFFTSHSRPGSFAKLRSYVIHHLFSPPIATAASTTNGVASLVSTSTIPTSSSSQVPFPHRANVVDRDQVLIPSGWDSWGKIRILRERFDADAAGKGWELDMDRMRERAQDDEDGIDSEGRKVSSMVKSYAQIIVDLDADDQPLNNAHSHLEAQDEQAFLQVHYDTLQQDREKDPRAAFAPRIGSNSGFNGADSLPGSIDPNHAARSPSLSYTSPNLANTSSPTFSSPGASPTIPSALGTPGGPAQNEVLANFFASLLAKRGDGSVAGAGLPPASPS